MNPLDMITFAVPGLVPQGDAENARRWITPQGFGVGLYFYPMPPDIAADLNNLQDVRAFWRSCAVSGGMGMVEADVVLADGCRALRTISKQPQQSGGMIYIGSLLAPFRDFSYVVKAQCGEQGMTGQRDALVLDAMLASGQINLSGMKEGGAIPGWAQDPYDPRLQTPLMRNLSEDPRYDAQFPDHPLSRVRVTLQQIQASLHIAPPVKESPPFVFPPAAPNADRHR